MRSVALAVVVAISSAAAAGCAPPCVDDRCSAKPPADVAARNHQATAEPEPPPVASAEPVPPAQPPEPPEPSVVEWAVRLGSQRGVIYTGGQLTIRYSVRASKADPNLGVVAFTYVNQSPGAAAVQFSVQGRDDSGKDLWTRRLGTARVNAGATSAATITTDLANFPLSISVVDVKLCPIGADDPASAPVCAQVKPEQGDTARLRRPADAR
jgi:hypothetical protein